jgi:hypothetical protein
MTAVEKPAGADVVTEMPSSNGLFAYEVTTEDTGETFTLHLKPASRMPWGIVEDVMEDDRLGVKAPLNWAMSAEDRLILRRVPQVDVLKMMEAWQESAGVTVGESVASPRSSPTNRAARRAKRT